jgi:uncharacterized membrane protein YecN with MAPEG domain
LPSHIRERCGKSNLDLKFPHNRIEDSVQDSLLWRMQQQEVAMQANSGFRRQQKLVALGMAAAALIAIGTIASTVDFAGGALSPAGRLARALEADLFVVFWLFAAIANVARLRFFSPQDIGGSAGESTGEDVRRASAILQNTLEQTVLAVPVHLALAALFARPMPLIFALAALFCVGRLLFWAGYAHGAPGRAFGFALTFYPTAFSLLMALIVLIGRTLT